MAARKRKLHLSEEWKEKIKVGVIMQRLMACAEGKDEMTASQLKAADILLKKSIPDLAKTELANPEGETFKTEAVITFVNADSKPTDT